MLSVPSRPGPGCYNDMTDLIAAIDQFFLAMWLVPSVAKKLSEGYTCSRRGHNVSAHGAAGIGRDGNQRRWPLTAALTRARLTG
jgi:hypothetical protein